MMQVRFRNSSSRFGLERMFVVAREVQPTLLPSLYVQLEPDQLYAPG